MRDSSLASETDSRLFPGRRSSLALGQDIDHRQIQSQLLIFWRSITLPTESASMSTKLDLIQKILHPSPDDAEGILDDLCLAGLPTREQVHREIEEKLLLPREAFPAHWLSLYQVYDFHQSQPCCQLIVCCRHWQHDLAVPSLLTFNPSPPPTSLTFVRTGLNGRVTGYVEVIWGVGTRSQLTEFGSRRLQTLPVRVVSRQHL